MPKTLLEALSEPAGIGDIDVEFPQLRGTPGDADQAWQELQTSLGVRADEGLAGKVSAKRIGEILEEELAIEMKARIHDLIMALDSGDQSIATFQQWVEFLANEAPENSELRAALYAAWETLEETVAIAKDQGIYDPKFKDDPRCLAEIRGSLERAIQLS